MSQMKVVVSPETHRRITEQIANTLVQRDVEELGHRPSRVEVVTIAASARIDAGRLVDRIIENVLGRTEPRTSPAGFVL